MEITTNNTRIGKTANSIETTFEPSAIECPECHKLLQGRSAFTRHIRAVHGIILSTSSTNDQSTTSTKITRRPALENNNNRNSSFVNNETVFLPIIDLGPSMCSICLGGDEEDKMLLCDYKNGDYICKNEIHMYCLSPPLEEIPEGDWYCPECANENDMRDYLLNCIQELHIRRGEYFQLFHAKFPQWIQSCIETKWKFLDWNVQLNKNDKLYPIKSEFSEFINTTKIIGAIFRLFLEQKEYVGRILQLRYDEYHECWEHLIQFKSTSKDLNKPLLIWVCVEEVSCLIGGELVWVKSHSTGWMSTPAQRYYRSALYLVENDAINPNHNENSQIKTTESNLLYQFGENRFLPDILDRYIMPFIGEKSREKEAIKFSRKVNIAYALAIIELEEQESTRRAYNLMNSKQLGLYGALGDGCKIKHIRQAIDKSTLNSSSSVIIGQYDIKQAHTSSSASHDISARLSHASILALDGLYMSSENIFQFSNKSNEPNPPPSSYEDSTLASVVSADEDKNDNEEDEEAIDVSEDEDLLIENDMSEQGDYFSDPTGEHRHTTTPVTTTTTTTTEEKEDGVTIIDEFLNDDHHHNNNGGDRGIIDKDEDEDNSNSNHDDDVNVRGVAENLIHESDNSGANQGQNEYDFDGIYHQVMSTNTPIKPILAGNIANNANTNDDTLMDDGVFDASVFENNGEEINRNQSYDQELLQRKVVFANYGSTVNLGVFDRNHSSSESMHKSENTLMKHDLKIISLHRFSLFDALAGIQEETDEVIRREEAHQKKLARLAKLAAIAEEKAVKAKAKEESEALAKAEAKAAAEAFKAAAAATAVANSAATHALPSSSSSEDESSDSSEPVPVPKLQLPSGELVLDNIVSGQRKREPRYVVNIGATTRQLVRRSRSTYDDQIDNDDDDEATAPVVAKNISHKGRSKESIKRNGKNGAKRAAVKRSEGNVDRGDLSDTSDSGSDSRSHPILKTKGRSARTQKQQQQESARSDSCDIDKRTLSKKPSHRRLEKKNTGRFPRRVGPADHTKEVAKKGRKAAMKQDTENESRPPKKAKNLSGGVDCWSLDGSRLLRRFRSLSEALFVLRLANDSENKAAIERCCDESGDSVFGFRWSWVDAAVSSLNEHISPRRLLLLRDPPHFQVAEYSNAFSHMQPSVSGSADEGGNSSSDDDDNDEEDDDVSLFSDAFVPDQEQTVAAADIQKTITSTSVDKDTKTTSTSTLEPTVSIVKEESRPPEVAVVLAADRIKKKAKISIDVVTAVPQPADNDLGTLGAEHVLPGKSSSIVSVPPIRKYSGSTSAWSTAAVDPCFNKPTYTKKGNYTAINLNNWPKNSSEDNAEPPPSSSYSKHTKDYDDRQHYNEDREDREEVSSHRGKRSRSPLSWHYNDTISDDRYEDSTHHRRHTSSFRETERGRDRRDKYQDESNERYRGRSRDMSYDDRSHDKSRDRSQDRSYDKNDDRYYRSSEKDKYRERDNKGYRDGYDKDYWGYSENRPAKTKTKSDNEVNGGLYYCEETECFEFRDTVRLKPKEVSVELDMAIDEFLNDVSADLVTTTTATSTGSYEQGSAVHSIPSADVELYPLPKKVNCEPDLYSSLHLDPRLLQVVSVVSNTGPATAVLDCFVKIIQRKHVICELTNRCQLVVLSSLQLIMTDSTLSVLVLAKDETSKELINKQFARYLQYMKGISCGSCSELKPLSFLMDSRRNVKIVLATLNEFHTFALKDPLLKSSMFHRPSMLFIYDAVEAFKDMYKLQEIHSRLSHAHLQMIFLSFKFTLLHLQQCILFVEEAYTFTEECNDKDTKKGRYLQSILVQEGLTRKMKQEDTFNYTRWASSVPQSSAFGSNGFQGRVMSKTSSLGESILETKLKKILKEAQKY